MKKLYVRIMVFFVVGNWQLINSTAFAVVVPKQSLVEKASLVVYMLDNFDQKTVGTCRLDEEFVTRNILPEDLKIQQQETIDFLHDSIDVTNASSPRDHEIILHIEFDKDIRIIRVLVVKDSLLADNPFDVLSISVDQSNPKQVNEFDEFDELSTLIDTIDPTIVKKVVEKPSQLLIMQYILYAKIFLMMQYKHAKRSLKDLMAWMRKI